MQIPCMQRLREGLASISMTKLFSPSVVFSFLEPALNAFVGMLSSAVGTVFSIGECQRSRHLFEPLLIWTPNPHFLPGLCSHIINFSPPWGAREGRGDATILISPHHGDPAKW